jgi:transposase
METTVVCRDCGLIVVRKMYVGDEPQTEWFCPDCDPDNGEDIELHQSNWMKTSPEFAYDAQRGREWLPPGFQECGPRQLPREIPDWVANRTLFEKIIKSHAQSQRYAAKWAKIVYYYFSLGYPTDLIASEMGIEISLVKNVIKKLRKRAKRLAAKEQKKAAEVMRAQELLRQGNSERQIAKALNCSAGKAHALAKLCKAA